MVSVKTPHCDSANMSCHTCAPTVRDPMAARLSRTRSKIASHTARYNGNVITRGIRAFVSRDWGAAREAKDSYWGDRIGRLGPLEGLRIADELRRQALLQDRAWPHADTRREDLAAHVRLARLL